MTTKKTSAPVYKESSKMLNPPKNYTRTTNTNQPDMKKVQKYYSDKKK